MVLIGDPIFLIMHVFVLGGILLIASLPGFTLGGQLKLVRDQIVALTFSSACLLAAVSASKVIGDDLRKGMIPTILSRPVPSSALLAGKWLGIVLSLLAIFFNATIAGLWATRLIRVEHSVESLGVTVYLGVVLLSLAGTALHHYLKGGSYFWQANLVLLGVLPIAFFILNFRGYDGVPASYGALVNWETSWAFVYLFMALMIFSAMLVFCAVFMDVSMLMTFAVVIFFAGLFSEYVLGLIIGSVYLRACFAIFLPDWQMFWVTESLGKISGFGVFFWSHLIHAVFQSILFITFSAILFRKQEITGTV